MRATSAPDSAVLLDRVNVSYQLGHLGAIVGPSGCGKSTLLKTIAGLWEPGEGEIWWRGRNVDADEDFYPSELGYVPQFSIFHGRLTVREVVTTATRLRTRRGDRGVPVSQWVDDILSQVGLDEIGDRRTEVLSGGQMRRLGLALEMVTRPSLLLCDEVTSGLDPHSEDEVVGLIRSLARDQQRLVLSVTHSLRHLHYYDSVTVLKAGRLVFLGPPDHLLPFFRVNSAEDVFPALEDVSLEEWQERFGLYEPYEQSVMNSVQTLEIESSEVEEPEMGAKSMGVMREPNALVQAGVLMGRRLRLFIRDPAQIGLQAALVLIFPLMVALFAYQGLPEIRNMSMTADQNVLEDLKDRLQYTIQTSRVGGLVSGLVMFQVVLLTLMGANNAAREIANERHIIEKEKLSGVRSSSILASKLVYLVPLVLVQACWMAVFVKWVGDIPGDAMMQWWMLIGVTGAMTATSLAISAWAANSEQASLISIYLVGFQLPLSGTVLALPDFIAPLVRPFIAAYWSWSGYLQGLSDSRFYDMVTQITHTPVAEFFPSCLMLSVHVLTGIFLTWLGLTRSQWK